MSRGKLTTRRARRGEARAWLSNHLAAIETTETSGGACVLWPFSTNGGEGGKYPQIRIEGANIRVTRHIAQHLLARPLADDELIRHWCDTPRCVNPWHFEIGTHDDNMADMVQRMRQASGERNGRVRLTAADVRDIRACVVDSGIRYGDVSRLARTYGVTPKAIEFVITGKTWRGEPSPTLA